MDAKNILLVEDNAVIAFVIQETLANLPHTFEVQIVSSGEDAMRQVDRKGWDLIITDHLLPGMTGLDLIHAEIERLPDTKWIVITAFGSAELEKELKRLKIHRYMTKPFPLEDLRQVVLEALDPHAPGDGALTFFVVKGLPPH